MPRPKKKLSVAKKKPVTKSKKIVKKKVIKRSTKKVSAIPKGYNNVTPYLIVNSGTKKSEEGFSWTFDQRLRCVSSTIPYEDELRAMFKAIEAPVCLIRAKQGVPYPENTFQGRAQSINNLIIHELNGGHHVHMDDPIPVAKIISQFLDS